jgi:hypothetical protein
MRDYTSAHKTRAKQAQPQTCLEVMPFFECAGCAGPGLIARDATLRGGALSGLLLCWDAAEQPVDVLCTRGTARSEGRLSLRHGLSGLVGRVLESGHTAGGPIVFLPSRAATTVRRVFTGAGALRVVDLASDGGAATEGDVAAGAGRGVAGFAR